MARGGRGGAPRTATITTDTALAALRRHRDRFNDLDREGWLNNFVERPYVEEPAGSEVRFGREHYAAIMDGLLTGTHTAHIEEPTLTIVNGSEAAVHYRVTITVDSVTTVSDIIEIFEIAEDGRIAGIQAFVPPEALAHTTAAGS